MLVVSSVISHSALQEPNKQNDSTNEQIVQLQDALEAGNSQIASLTDQIAKMEHQVIELETALDEKTAENRMLKKEALDLSNAITDIETQLSFLEKNEQVYLIVDRLRHPVNVSEDGSLCEGWKGLGQKNINKERSNTSLLPPLSWTQDPSTPQANRAKQIIVEEIYSNFCPNLHVSRNSQKESLISGQQHRKKQNPFL